MSVTGASHDEAERAFLQNRLALFAKVGFFLSAATDVLTMFVDKIDDLLAPESLLDRGITLLFGLMWLFASRGSYSQRFLRAFDAFTAGLASIAVAIMSRYLMMQIAPGVVDDLSADPSSAVVMRTMDAYISMMFILGGAIMFMLRAAVVPSPPRFTLFVTAVLGLPYLLVPWLVAPVSDGALTLRDAPFRTPVMINFLIWWGVVVALCVVTSHVIYGLRREVRSAQRLGQYTLMQKLGEGGMGIVYRAQHARLRRPTAIKLLPPGKLSDDAIARFEAEVQLTAELTHPNTVTVFDYGRTEDGVFYYAMEYLDGATLDEVVSVGGEQPPSRVLRILQQVASALQEAHDVGLIHRDIKPANIMLTRQGVDRDAVKLLDFGLARVIDQGEDAGLTRDNRIVGTPLFMAPEVIKDAAAMSERSDLYALGAVGYFLLTGSHVFSGESVVEICAHHLHTAPEPPSSRIDTAIPDALEALIMDCLRKSPDTRPQSAAEVAERLTKISAGVWTDADAERWWSDHRDEVVRQRGVEARLDDIRLTVA